MYALFRIASALFCDTLCSLGRVFVRGFGDRAQAGYYIPSLSSDLKVVGYLQQFGKCTLLQWNYESEIFVRYRAFIGTNVDFVEQRLC